MRNVKNVLKSVEGKIVEVRGQRAPVYAPRGGVVRDHQTPIKPVHVYVNDKYVGKDDHLNIFGGNIHNDHKDLCNVLDQVKVGDVVRVVGKVVKYHRSNGRGGHWDYGLSEIVEVEVV